MSLCPRCKKTFSESDKPQKEFYFYHGGSLRWPDWRGLCPSCFDKEGRDGYSKAISRESGAGACPQCGGIDGHLDRCWLQERMQRMAHKSING